jgi:ABC-2 type transport system ATP-binding protein
MKMDYTLEIDSVEKRYKGFTLEDVSLQLNKGYIMGLIGPNGAGKTTLIKLILNLIHRDGGAIRVFGLDNLADEAEIKSRIGFVPDEPRFHDDATLGRVAAAVAPYYAKWDSKRFATLAGEFELPLKKNFKKLSHGTKTKFALALALSHGAELVLLDEPTTGLDPVFRRRLLDKLAGLLEGERTSVLFSSHITADLERTADFVTFVKNGRVVFSESMDRVAQSWAVVKGGRDTLDNDKREFLDGLRVRSHGFEGLTSRVEEARRHFGNGYVIERASLDDIMVLFGKEGSNDA